MDNFPRIEAGICHELHNENMNKAIAVFNEEMDVVYRKSKIRLPVISEKDSMYMKTANEHFEDTANLCKMRLMQIKVRR